MNENKQPGNRAAIIGGIVLIILLVLAIKGIFSFLEKDLQGKAGSTAVSSASQSIETPDSGHEADQEGPSFCPFCGKELNDSFRWGQFCPYCGKKVEQ